MGSRRRKTTTTRRREKREQRREKREDRRQTHRGRQRSPNEAARGPTRGANPFLGHAAPCWDLWRPHFGTEGRGKRAEKREKREETREKMAASSIHCISTVSRDHLEKVLKIRNGHLNIFTAYLRCPVTTSKSAQKYFSSLLPKV